MVKKTATRITMTLSMPKDAAAKLLEGYKNKDPKLLALLEEYKIEKILQTLGSEVREINRPVVKRSTMRRVRK